MACIHTGPGSFSEVSWEMAKVGKHLFKCTILTNQPSPKWHPKSFSESALS